MKERPILFSAPMVKAILDGKKTQTRRVVKKQDDMTSEDIAYLNRALAQGSIASPYGVPGDHLWVRETHMIESNRHVESESEYPPPFSDGRPINRMPAIEDVCDAYWQQCHYAATDPKPELVNLDTEEPLGWRPSIHMPRWASRISLVVKSVRVERLQDIKSTDAIAEGMDGSLTNCFGPGCAADCNTHGCYGPRRDFRELWESINGDTGPNSWIGNPFVWVIEFERVGRGALQEEVK